MKAIIFRVCTMLFLVGGLSVTSPAFAQHEGLSPNDPQDPNHLEYSTNDDKTVLGDHDTKARLAARDSIAAVNRTASGTTVKSKSQENKSADGDDDDALSFNFLYYIIQKFKISDLIDE